MRQGRFRKFSLSVDSLMFSLAENDDVLFEHVIGFRVFGEILRLFVR